MKRRPKKGFPMWEVFRRKDEATYLGVCEEVVGWFLTEQLHRGKVTGGGVSRQLLQQRPAAAAAVPPGAAVADAAAESIPGLFPVRPKSSHSALICPLLVHFAPIQ